MYVHVRIGRGQQIHEVQRVDGQETITVCLIIIWVCLPVTYIIRIIIIRVTYYIITLTHHNIPQKII